MNWFRPAALALAAAACSAPAKASTLRIIYDTGTESARTSLQPPVPLPNGQVIGQSYGFQDYGQIYLLTPARRGALYTKTTIHNFAFNDKPSGNLTPDASGNLWGTTGYNGDNNNGWLFELVKPATVTGSWTYKYVFSLPASLGASNSNGYGSLIFDTAGNLYGLSIGGTVANGCYGNGCGAIWEIPAATLAGGSAPITTLVTIPQSLQVATSMIRDAHGHFFATAQLNGDPGLVWEASAGKGGVYGIKAIHTFCSIHDAGGDCVDGEGPSGLAVTPAGSLYGTTYAGGTDTGISGCCSAGVLGIVFSMQPKRHGVWAFNVVHNFLEHTPDGTNTADIGLGYATGLTLAGNHLLLTVQDGGPDGTDLGCQPGSKSYPQACPLFQGGLVSVAFGGADAIVNNSFSNPAGSPPISGPSGPMFAPIRGARGTVLGATANFYTPTNGYAAGVIYEITP